MRLLVTVVFLLFAGSAASAAGDLAQGEKLFAKCKTCHAVGPDAKNKVGPMLNGVVGREWGAVEGYKYSQGREGTLLAITEADPQVWDVDTLTAYLRKPKDVIPRGKMAYPGTPKDEDIENIIFYLASFDADGNQVDPEEVLSSLGNQ